MRPVLRMFWKEMEEIYENQGTIGKIYAGALWGRSAFPMSAVGSAWMYDSFNFYEGRG